MTPDQGILTRLQLMGPRKRALIALWAGLMVGLGQEPFGLWPVTLMGLVLTFVLFAAVDNPRKAAWTGWLIATGSYLVSMHWIVEPFLVDVARHGWMAPFALVFLAGGLALFWALAFGVAKRWGGILMLLPLLGVAELVRGYIFTGFPWNLPGYIWLDTPVAQMAAWVGPYGLTLWTFVMGAVAAAGQIRPRWQWASLIALAVMIGIPWTLGRSEPEVKEGPIIRMVQPNAVQHLKWHPDHMATFFNRAIAASQAAPAPDLIVWPETSVPALLHNAQGTLAYMSDMAGGVPIVAGIQRRDEAGDYFNSLLVIGPGGAVQDIYDKHHLVPFGEYLPLNGVMARLGLSALADLYGGGYAKGSGPQVIDLPGIGIALPLICYEAVFPRDLRTDTRPDLILHITNDGWFGNFSGPYQHLAQARFRAIEQGLPVVRAANTGVSAMIDTQGRILGQIPLNQDGYLDIPLPKPAMSTIYAQFGEIPVIVALIFLFIAAIWSQSGVNARTEQSGS